MKTCFQEHFSATGFGICVVIWSPVSAQRPRAGYCIARAQHMETVGDYLLDEWVNPDVSSVFTTAESWHRDAACSLLGTHEAGIHRVPYSCLLWHRKCLKLLWNTINTRLLLLNRRLLRLYLKQIPVLSKWRENAHNSPTSEIKMCSGHRIFCSADDIT